MNQKSKNQGIRFSIRKKLFLLSAVMVLPFLCMLIYLLSSMAEYSGTYESIVNNMTIANDYNLNFKEEMDESLYKLVVGYVTFDNISEDEILKNPYDLIEDLRAAFAKLMDITTESESEMWLQSLMRNINTLEKRVDDIVESVNAGGRYDENIEKLDNNIYILTELIQDDIQYYIYYQTRSMEKVTEGLNQRVSQFIILSGIMVVVLTVVAGVIILLLISQILKPVKALYGATEKMAEGDFSARALVFSADEFSVLANGFNTMAENTQILIDKIKEDERKMRRADLRLLQEQINPHFLYNTLDTIVWLIECGKTDEAVEMVVDLSNFFRLALSKGKEFISIREEEQHIRSYLEIQEVRYRDILEYEIAINPKLYEYRILKLTLQPLVENALYHGIKYKRAKGSIHVSGEKKGESICLIVQDDGAGMEEAELAQLQKEISRPCKETEKGFGLANVNERIRMYFGPEYGLKIDSVKGAGTKVEVVIPAVRWEVERQHEEASVE